MAFPASVVKVMIASPGDVEEERQIAREVLYDWNCVHAEEKKAVLLPIGWETHSTPEMGDRPQAIINKQILLSCDILVAIFWTRLGSPTGKAASGTAEEIEEHLNAGKHAMLYFSSKPVSLDRVDRQQYAALEEFKAAYIQRGLVDKYTTNDEFRNKLYRHLVQTMNRVRFVPEYVDSEHMLEVNADMPVLSETARTALLEASVDPSGNILRADFDGGLAFLINGKEFPEEQNPRSMARWEAAIQELENSNLLIDRKGLREVFHVTEEGYRVAEILRADPSAATAASP
jgi:hypothetical protein